MPYKDPAKAREWRRGYMQDYRAAPGWNDHENSRKRQLYSERYPNGKGERKPFAGVDGEGATIGDTHRYVLLRAGDHLLTDDRGLSWHTILKWLTDLPDDREWVSFFFDYDVTMILRGGSWDQVKRLVKTGKAWFGEFFVTYIPRKEFKVTRMVKADGKWVRNPATRTFRVSDTCTFFQTAFVNVIRDWSALTPELREKIAEGKERRSVVEHLDDEMVEYNRLECEALADVMEQLRDACDELDLRPRKWQGPANITRAMFAKHSVPRRDQYEDRIPKQVLEIGRAAYYGGRFEVSQYGRIAGLVSELDIASAYPAALAQMPCIAHASWRHGVGTPGADTGHPSRLLHVKAKGLDAAAFYGLPYRDKDGGVWWPADVEGWYWDFEVAQAIHQDVQILEYWEWVPQCEHKPFAWLSETFAQRKALGKSTKGKPLKLGMNSGYGLMAQTVGSPVYACHVMASYITAWCRAKVMEAIHDHGCRAGDDECGSRVVMVATDALFVRGSHLIGLDDSLGSWELKTHEDGLFIVQAGVYFTAEHAKTKARGTPVRLIAERRANFEASFDRMVSTQDMRTGDVYVPCQRFVGLRDAVHRGNAARMGTFVWLGDDSGVEGKRIGFDWHSKRAPVPVSAEAGGCLVTSPRESAGDVRSHAYPKVVPGSGGSTDDTPDEWGQLALFG